MKGLEIVISATMETIEIENKGEGIWRAFFG